MKQIVVLFFLIFVLCNLISKRNKKIFDENLSDVEAPVVDVGITNNQLWNKYRSTLMLSISKQFCNGQQTCPELSTTGAQMVTDATTCDRNNNEELTKLINYAPAYGPSYKISTTSYDGQITELYRKFLLQTPNQQEGMKRFVKFEKSSKLWEEKSTPLHDMINVYKNRMDRNYKFEFDVHTPETFNNAWSDLGSWYPSEKGFIREVSSDKSSSDSDFIFGTKKVYHTVIVKEIKVTLSSKFRVSFSAVDVVPIRVTPSESWFDYNFLMENKETLKNLGYLGKDGKFSLLPKILYVAFKPQIEIVISKSQYEAMKTSLEQQSTLGYLVGGLTFNKPNAVALSDAEAKSDRIVFTLAKTKLPKIEKLNKKDLKEEYEKQFDELVEDKHFKNEFLSEWQFRRSLSSRVKSDNRALSEWLFRRRTRHITIIRREIQYVPEGDYKLSFVNSGDHPQILAIVSDRL